MIALVFYGVDIEIGIQVQRSLESQGVFVDFFLVCRLSQSVITKTLLDDFSKYNTVVLIDTGKSEIHYSSELALSLSQSNQNIRVFRRIPNSTWSEVSNDTLEFNVNDIVSYVLFGVK